MCVCLVCVVCTCVCMCMHVCRYLRGKFMGYLVKSESEERRPSVLRDFKA